jgi:hypothetical protein
VLQKNSPPPKATTARKTTRPQQRPHTLTASPTKNVYEIKNTKKKVRKDKPKQKRHWRDRQQAKQEQRRISVQGSQKSERKHFMFITMKRTLTKLNSAMAMKLMACKMHTDVWSAMTMETTLNFGFDAKDLGCGFILNDLFRTTPVIVRVIIIRCDINR